MANPFVHLELCTSDAGKAKEFYTNLFGWSFTDTDMGGGMIYSTFKPDSGPGGGLFSMPGMPTFWLAYVGVDRYQCRNRQGQVARSKSTQGTLWKFLTSAGSAIIVDPTGATIALFQPKQPM